MSRPYLGQRIRVYIAIDPYTKEYVPVVSRTNKMIDATIIAVDTDTRYSSLNTCLIGWEHRPDCESYPLWNDDGTYSEDMEFPECDHVDNPKRFQYGWWIDANLAWEPALFIEGQVCLECKLPCPHKAPNAKEGYRCVSCQFISSLGA
jgi:hypothetical protein